MQEEIEHYEFQLEQVKLALETDPHNFELKKLLQDLNDLIDLAKQLHQQQQPQPSTKPPSSSSSSLSSSSSSSLSSVTAKSTTTTTTTSIQPRPPPPSPSLLHTEDDNDNDTTPSTPPIMTWKVGDTVYAQWHDQQWYPANITAVSTKWSDKEPLYSVVFAGGGYTTVELKTASEVRSIHDDAPPPPPPPSSSHLPSTTTNSSPLTSTSTSSSSWVGSSGQAKPPKKPTTTSTSTSSSATASKRKATKETARKKAQKQQLKLSQLEHMHQHAQQSWLHFASGGQGVASHPSAKKKQTHQGKWASATGVGGYSHTTKPIVVSSLAPVPILKKKSMFATPDNPFAKVGVIGSGKKMTEFSDRGKHRFEVNEN